MRFFFYIYAYDLLLLVIASVPVTITLTGPVPGGVVHVIEVADATTLVAEDAPNLTVPPDNPVPVMVTN
jgi:hypothetical protein